MYVHCISQITVLARGQGSDLPVYVKRSSTDLKICIIDRLYQDSIEVFNRGHTPFRISFHIPSELRPYMEVLPQHGLVQASSSFNAQLKFLPRPGIFSNCTKFFEEKEEKEDNDCLTAQVEIRATGQVYVSVIFWLAYKYIHVHVRMYVCTHINTHNFTHTHNHTLTQHTHTHTEPSCFLLGDSETGQNGAAVQPGQD